MARHVFRDFDSFIHHYGEFVRETDKMVFWKSRRGGSERRGDKDGHLVIDTRDPETLEREYSQSYRHYTPLVDEARETLARAEKERREKALAAALAKAEATR